MPGDIRRVIWFEDLSRGDVSLVGGKNASLGEMVRAFGAEGIRVPPGFATTAEAFRDYLAANRLNQLSPRRSSGSTPGSWRCTRPARRSARRSLAAIGRPDTVDDIRVAYRELGGASARMTRPSRCAPVPPPRTCPMRASPGSRRPSSTFAARRRCSTPAGAASPRSSPTAPSATGETQGLRSRQGRAVGRRAAHGALRPRQRRA